MNNTSIIITALIVIVIILIIIRSTNIERLEPLTVENEEAIQNIASVYNKDQMTVTNMTATNNTTTDALKTNKLQLGNKWVLTASGKDTTGNDDDWLRFTNAAGTYFGGIAAGKFYDSKVGTISDAIQGLQNQIGSLSQSIQNNRINCNWAGWNVVCGNCSDNHDDYALFCDGGKVTTINVGNNSNWGYNGRNLPGYSYPW